MGAAATLGLIVVLKAGASDGDAPLVAQAAAKETMAEPMEPEATTAPRPSAVGQPAPSPTPATALGVTDEPAVARPELEVAAPTLETKGALASDGQRVQAALMQRKIRALDILLVSPEAKRKVRRKTRVSPMSWANAQAYCETLDIEGVEGWRLPTAGEFRTLSGGNMLDRSSYWSATEADAFGSDRVVWNNRKKSMSPAPGEWKGGRVLCVRLQHLDGTPT